MNGTTGSVSDANLTNTLESVSIAGSKTWEGPVEQVRYAAGGITLTVLADEAAMSPQPEISWTKTGDVWTYSISGLPDIR